MTFKARKRLAILVLVLGLPAYIILAVVIVGQFERPSLLVELAVYVGLGVIWALPLKRLFLGIARPDPDGENETE
ncbi:DUF2842 domain-containing protein [Sinisalibacter aestuarii]|uniref:DUF2842 domain-containing protein n=1 Tax=Sinisalibacter aestuarii TaxID=2949426 RepID=A0ABQ5LUI4_9RHOB|nr:DUF2842 domain-containing protein [Sinisalibacter aestuarii]GKY88647.1 hypothetical protein STA1M1_25160 [Sinisalibacter aestuarii]